MSQSLSLSGFAPRFSVLNEIGSVFRQLFAVETVPTTKKLHEIGLGNLSHYN